MGEAYYAGSVFLGTGLIIYSMASGDIQQKGRQLLPAPKKRGYVSNVTLIDSHRGAVKAHAQLENTLSEHDIAIVEGEGGLGKFSTVVDYATHYLSGQDNASLFVIDSKIKSSYQDSYINCAKALNLCIKDKDFDDITKSIYSELLRRKGPSFFIHKCVREWALTEDYFPQVSKLRKILGIQQKHVMTSGSPSIIALAKQKKIEHITFSESASMLDLKNIFSDTPHRLAEFQQGYGIQLLYTIDYNMRLMVELEPHLKHSQEPLSQIIQTLNNTTDSLDKKRKVLEIAVKDLTLFDLQILSLICPSHTHQKGQILTDLKTQFSTLVKKSVNTIDKPFHRSIGMLQDLNLIKYDDESDLLFSRILLVQHDHLHYLIAQKQSS